MPEEATILIRLSPAQALAAGAVLRGYLAHQRERLGEQAESNPNFRNVAGALDAIDAALGVRRDQSGASGQPAEPSPPRSQTPS
jgi:hypothetical protein